MTWVLVSYRALTFQRARKTSVYPSADDVNPVAPPIFQRDTTVFIPQKLRTPLVGAKGYQMFPLFKPGVGI